MNLSDLEKDSDLLSVTYKSIKIWMLLRIKISLKIKEKDLDLNSDFRSRNIVILIKNIYYGIFNIFRLKKFKYLFFANTDKRKLLDGKYYDVYFDRFADEYGQEKSLFIEYTTTTHISKKHIYSDNAISDLIFKTGAALFSIFINIRKVKNIVILKGLLEKNNIDINIESNIRSLLGEYYFYKFILKKIKPKIIYVFCYYSKLPLIAAAKQLNLPIYEVQHGLITEKNDFYYTSFHAHSAYFPDKLLSFGINLKENKNINFIYKTSNIYPIGSYYLNYIKNNYKNSYLEQLQKNYQKIVCVTLQRIYIEEIMGFVANLADKYKTILFIVKPKDTENVSEYLSDNIILLPDYNIYQILKYSNFNISIYSMVAIEAAYFNVYNVLYNICGLSERYLKEGYGGEILPVGDNINLLDNSKKIECKYAGRFFVRDYEDNVANFCKENY